MRRGLLFVLIALPFAVACGLSVTGQLDSTSGGPGGENGGIDGGGGGDAGGGGSDGASADGGADVIVAPTCDGGLAADALLLPGDAGACPSGTTGRVGHTNPTAQAGACTCGTCAVTTEGSCAGNNLVWTWGSNGGCTDGPASYDITADNACIQVFNNNTTIAAYNKWSRVPSGGACTAPAVKNVANVTTTTVNECVLAAAACVVPQAGDRVCVPADPDGGACAGTFSVPFVTGDGAALDCGACGCTRTGACHVEYFSNSGCTTKVYERDADNTCATTGTPQMQRIKVYPKDMVCNTTPGAATASLTNAKRYCCTP